MWDPIKVRDALATNARRGGASRHGGKRVKEGKVLGGRKKKVDRDQPLAKPFREAVTVETIITRAGPPEGAITVMDLLKVRPEELEALCKYATHVGLTVAHVDLMKAVQHAQLTALEIERERGTLIEVSAMTSGFASALGQIRTKIEQLPSIVVGNAATSLRLDPDQQAALRAIVRAAGESTMQMLAVELDRTLREVGREVGCEVGRGGSG